MKSEKTSWRKSNAESASVRIEVEGRMRKPEVEERMLKAQADETLPKPSVVNERISDEEEVSQAQIQEDQPAVLTDKEMNELSAKILKAEMLGNQVRHSSYRFLLASAQ